ncbi:MAG: TetR family transcriptional regulator [Deltaproteobacteria bacterium]|nr:TetR family transcriptional regulator [Deltaproteobacteria bacterium]
MKEKFILKQEQLFNTAAALFAEKGYHGTSINDLAQAMGLQKGSLYHYFKSKEELLFMLLDEYISAALLEIEKICALNVDAVEKLRLFMLFYSSFYAGDRDRLVLLINDIDKLSEALRLKIIEKERRYTKALTDIFSQLQAAGIMKKIPPAVAAFAFFGMVHYTCKWFQQDGPVSAEALGEMFLEIFTNGVFVNPVTGGDVNAGEN